MSTPIRSVLLVIAIDNEAAPIVKRLGLNKIEPSPFKSEAFARGFSGTCGDLTVYLAQNGYSEKYGVWKVGTDGAALTTYLSIEAFKPDLVISAGTAGGFKKQGAVIGSIFLSTRCMNHDRRIEVPGYKEFGLDMVETIQMSQVAKELGFLEGVVSTGNSLDYTENCMDIMTTHGAAVKEMEACAVSAVCRDFDVPFVALKVITDIVDGERPAHEEFLQNLTHAVEKLTEGLSQLLPAINLKSLEEL